MKLIALKRISRQLPEGAVFEMDPSRARALVAMKAAKAYEDTPDVPPVSPRRRGGYGRKDLQPESV